MPMVSVPVIFTALILLSGPDLQVPALITKFDHLLLFQALKVSSSNPSKNRVACVPVVPVVLLLSTKVTVFEVLLFPAASRAMAVTP